MSFILLFDKFTDQNLELSNATIEALMNMSTSEQAKELNNALSDALVLEDVDVLGGYTQGMTANPMDDWALDEELMPWQKLAPEELMSALGVDSHLEGMAHFRDPDLEVTAWNSKEHPWYKGLKRRTPLVPRHHQLVGVHKALSWIVGDTGGGLIADEVGVGKTGLMLTTIATHIRLIKQEESNNAYPPRLGKHQFVWFGF